jgi:uncharacterized SAM-binding protein YcdF (DUF218 family)
MFFLFSKILNFAITPFFWIIALLVWALFTRRPDKKKRRMKYFVVSLLFFTNGFILNEIVRAWEIQPHNIEEGHYDVAIVLGGMTYQDEDLNRVVFRSGSDRLFQALDLYNRGTVDKILISGGSGYVTKPHLRESKWIKDYLERAQFPMEDLIIEIESKNTRENAQYTKDKLSEFGLQNGKHILVTSAMHMRRSEACFSKVGLDFETYSTDYWSMHRSKMDFEAMIVPKAVVLLGWRNFMHELIGYITYKIMGYI